MKGFANGSGSIDVHVHWAPKPYAKALAELETRTTDLSLDPLMFDLDQRLKWMDEHRVQTHVLTLTGQMPWQRVSQDAAARFAQIVNDAAIEAHTAYPDRFLAGVAMPIRDPASALQELNRVAGKPGMRAVHLPNSIEGHDYLFEPAYAPILSRCEELGYPLLFHPLGGLPNLYGGPKRLAGPSFISNTLGFPFDTATTAAKFIVSGTLDKFPKLEIVLPHSGGTFPYIAGRMEHGVNGAASNVKLQRPFREYIRRFHYDTITYYPETLRFLISLVGSDRVVIGTDNYAVMDVKQPNALVEQLNLPAADQDRILRANAIRLFHL